MCEIFLKNLCLGCQALERLEDIDRLNGVLANGQISFDTDISRI